MRNKLEKERLESLRSYDILDSVPDKTLDSLTTLAAHICGTPISLITLLDEDRQWFMSKVGIDIEETAREVAFCNQAIEQKDLFEVTDAEKDKRFNDNPLVKGDPKVRFYAGVPLISEDGYALGTLCVIDMKPGKLDDAQQEAIKTLSQLVMTCIETKRQQKQLREALKLRKEFIDDMNYEMRTPLNAIMGLSAVLSENNKDQKLKDDFKLLNESAEDVVTILNELTDASRPGTELPIQNLVFSLHNLLEEIVKKLTEQHDLEIKLVYDFGIPDLIEGDLDRLRHLLQHLVFSQLMGRSHTKLLLDVETLVKKDHEINIRFELTDQSDEVLPKDGRSLLKQNLEKEIAEDITKLLQGTLTTLPHQKSVDLKFVVPYNNKNRIQDAIVNDTREIRGVNLLLVEDLETNQKIASKFLNMWGVKFDIANNGMEAIEAVLEKHYDVILMDMRMPVMDGYEAVMKIKSMKEKAYKKLPIIALTASVSSPMEDRVRDLDLAGFVTKPFNPNELKRKIAMAIGPGSK